MLKKRKIICAKSAGFCWGVKRAIEIAREVSKDRPTFTDGPLIHNRQMMEKLQAEGITELSPETKSNGVIIVRAHGISPERRKSLKALSSTFKDATCPHVGMIAGKIRIHAKKGYQTLIFGDPKHPEVIGLMGYTEGKGYVVRKTEDIAQLPPLGDKICMVSQSTMFPSEFAKISSSLKNRYPKALVFDTICAATKERQKDVLLLAQEGAQAIVVIGGHHSANTVKLTALVKQQNLPAYHVESAEELPLEQLKEYDVIGVTAGASTPGFLIDAVREKLEAF